MTDIAIEFVRQEGQKGSNRIIEESVSWEGPQLGKDSQGDLFSLVVVPSYGMKPKMLRVEVMYEGFTAIFDESGRIVFTKKNDDTKLQEDAYEN